MINLLSNAIKFSPQGGHIAICKEVHADRLIVKIKDNGPGISSENLAILGRPYVRVETDTKGSKFESTGLGLSVCHKLIGQHNGHLRLESAVGCGTTAIFDLPMG